MDEAWKTMCHLGCEKSHWKLKYGVWMKLFSPFVVPTFMFIGEAWGTGNHPSWIQEILFEAQMWGMGGVVLTFYSPNFHVCRWWGLSSKIHPSWIWEILLEAQMWGMGGVILTFYCPNFHVYRWGLNNSKPIILDLRNLVRPKYGAWVKLLPHFLKSHLSCLGEGLEKY